MVRERSPGTIRDFYRRTVRPFSEITDKYRTPRLKTTRQVKAALLFLRIYLLAMVGLLIVKFFTSV